MSNYQVASRYAKSLIDLSVEQNKLEDIKADMQYIQKALDSRDLLLLFKSPIIQAGKKTAIVQEVFKGKISDMTLGFLKIITKKGREKFLPEIVKSYLDQYKKHKNITDVKLTTASSISDDVKTSLEKALLDSNVTANSVEVETVVDEDILGGFVIEVGDKLYDASVRHKLNKIKKEFTENKYIKSF